MSDAPQKLPVTGAVLAGGHSDRMGADKTLLQVAGEPLLSRVLDAVGQTCERTVVVTSRPEALSGFALPEGVDTIEDEVPFQGPLGGLVTALAQSEHEWVLAVASDLPWLEPGVVRALWDARGQAQVVVPISDAGREPLLALYHESCLAPAREVLASGRRRLVAVLPHVAVTEVPLEALRAVDPELASFVNVNTPEDLIRAREEAPEQRGPVRVSLGDRGGDSGRRLPSERPVTVHLNDVEVATVQATPADLEDLAAGLLASEGLLVRRDALQSIAVDDGAGLVWVRSGDEIPDDLRHRRRYITSGCGQGVTFASADDMDRVGRVPDGPVMDEGDAYHLVRSLAHASERYLDTGGMHACGLAVEGELVLVREDVGRHNALDKLLGRAWLDGIETRGALVASSGRISYEMAVKCAAAGVSIVVSRTAVTDLAAEVAEVAGITLVGYARGGRMVVYTRPERISGTGDER